MTPDAPRPGSTVTFDNLFDLAIATSASYKKTYAHALDLGIRPDDVVRYAVGAMPPGVRACFESVLLQSPWALDRVAAVVRACERGGLPAVRVPRHDDDVEFCMWLDML